MDKKSSKVDLTVAFQQLRQRFALGLPQRSAAMVNLIEHDSVEHYLPLIKADAHKLAGACGTFGYAKLGLQARQIEQLASVIQGKPADEQRQSLPALRRAILELDVAVTSALQQTVADANTVVNALDQHGVWLLLDNQELTTQLTTQLSAFGLRIEHFSDFDSCLQRLQTASPVVLFSAHALSNGQSIFTQKLMLNLLEKQNCRLMLYAANDSFELRIKAAQQRAAAFFISQLDVPYIISTITQLIEQATESHGRVFIVDDDKLLAEHYSLVLNAIGIQTKIIQNVRNIIDELVKFQPDLLIMDMYMPDYSGTELAGLIRQYQSLKRLPIVFLSSEANKQLQLRAMAYGADDFLTKPIDDAHLAQVIKVRLSRSIQIKNLIDKDSLTALVKHSAIKDIAELEFERAARNQTPMSIVMLDIDRFKAVNDSYGHAAGDVVITSLATLLRKRIRKTDRAGRYGGEEFMLVLPDCDNAQATLLVKQILQAFSVLPFTAGDASFYCTFSAGVAATTDREFENAEHIMAAADEALYRAKNAGRNQVCS